jgi:hypothetical protein
VALRERPSPFDAAVGALHLDAAIQRPVVGRIHRLPAGICAVETYDLIGPRTPSLYANDLRRRVKLVTRADQPVVDDVVGVVNPAQPLLR